MIDRRAVLLGAAASATVATTGLGSAPAGAAPAPASDPAQRARLDALYNKMWQAEIRHSPQKMTSLGLDREAGGEWAKSKLDDRSPEAFETHMNGMRETRATLKSIDRGKLSGLDAVNYDVADFHTAITLEGYDRFKFGEPGYPRAYAVNQLDGVFNNTPDFLENKHRIESKSDADAYLARLSQFATVLDQETARAKAGAAAGATPPDFILDTCILQLSKLKAAAPADARLAKSIGERAAAKSIAGDWQGRATTIVERAVYPAIERQIEELRRQRRTANHDAGAWRLPDGEAYYDWGIHLFNTKKMTGPEIHKLGLEMVAENTAEIEVILKGAGKTRGSLVERINALAVERGGMYENSDAGRAKVVADANRQIGEIEALLPRYFNTVPRAKVVAKRVPVEIEAGKAGGYYNHGSIDGTLPGTYYVNLRDMSDRSVVGLATLTHHEAIPGHHMQISLSLENERVPLWRRKLECSAFVEGWALYSQTIADEMGIFEKDPLGKLGYLQSELFRAARLVVDSGLNWKRWSREQAIDYMVGATGSSRDSVTSEVDRYCLIPGQAPSYKIGQREWLRVREKARTALGDKFDIRAFHDAGLLAGIMQLGVLEKHIDAWVVQQA
ncbi:DUF885 domain-containing protein [Sphingoaurantiacus capsulatus]|uniref:DUF885 domain-containing protein n=1 Tax=Sphingoaurantiacus capsulatus TaxID=1771310 RepID=A0ABV7XBJ7_9SPHN